MSLPEPPSKFPRLVASNEPGLPQVTPQNGEAPAEEEEVRGRTFFSSGNRIVLGATFVIIAAFLVTVAFAATIPINRGSIAIGRIEAQGTRTVIQHLDGGTVERLLVKKGDPVRAGQLLIKLDDRTARLALQLLEEQRRLLLIEQSMLQAERAGTPIAWPPEVLANAADPSIAQAMRANESLLASRRSARQAEKAVLAEGITRLQAQVTGLEEQRRGQQEQARLIKLEADSLQKLYDQGLTTRTRILALQRSNADLEGSIGTTTSAINQARVQMTESRLRMITIDQDMQRENAKRLQELQSTLFELDDRIASQRLVVERTAITSPVDGIVLERAVNSVGAVVRPGEPVLEIVPNEKLVVRANVRPQDIDRVQVGDRAVVRLSGLNMQTTPRLYGRVTYVSADAFAPEGQPPFYEARVEVPEGEMRKLQNVKVTPGMQTEVMIDAGARTVLSYLLQPVTGAFGRTFLE